MSRNGDDFESPHPFSDGVCAEYANTIITYSIMLVHREIENKVRDRDIASEMFKTLEEELTMKAALHVEELVALSKKAIEAGADPIRH